MRRRQHFVVSSSAVKHIKSEKSLTEEEFFCASWEVPSHLSNNSRLQLFKTPRGWLT